MKKLIILIILLTGISMAKNVGITSIGFPQTKHKGPVWTITTYGEFYEGEIPNAKYVKTNAIRVKWNIEKGRIAIQCNGLCKEDEKILIRMFDKDSLRIDFALFNLEVDKYLSGNEYIVPKEFRSEIAFMDIVRLYEGSEAEKTFNYEVICEDGYEYRTKTDIEVDGIEWFDNLDRFFNSECVKTETATFTQDDQFTELRDKIDNIINMKD